MSDPAPDYEGLTPILVPCDGRKLPKDDYPTCFEELWRNGKALVSWDRGTFKIPSKSIETIKDDKSYATIVRTTLIDLRTGLLHWKAEKIDYLDYFKL